MKLKIIIPVAILVVWLGAIIAITWERDYDYIRIGISYDNLIGIVGELNLEKEDPFVRGYYGNKDTKFLGYYYKMYYRFDHKKKLNSYYYVRRFDKENVAKEHFMEVRKDLIEKYGTPFSNFSDYEAWKDERQWSTIWSFESKQDFGGKTCWLLLEEIKIDNENQYQIKIGFIKQ